MYLYLCVLGPTCRQSVLLKSTCIFTPKNVYAMINKIKLYNWAGQRGKMAAMSKKLWLKIVCLLLELQQINISYSDFYFEVKKYQKEMSENALYNFWELKQRPLHRLFIYYIYILHLFFFLTKNVILETSVYLFLFVFCFGFFFVAKMINWICCSVLVQSCMGNFGSQQNRHIKTDSSISETE